MNTHALSDIFKPDNYNLDVALDRPGRTFSGTVRIRGVLQPGAEAVVLHAKDVTIANATINGQSAEVTTEPNDYNEVFLRQPGLQPGDHTIVLTFSGAITDPMHGLYPSKTKVDGIDIELLATQFESHHAREVFPCIDEPAAKATFDLTLRTEPDITTLSNMPVKTQTRDGERMVTTFQTSPVMSTYLLAWVVGLLGYKEATTKDGVVVRGYATTDKVDQLDFAVDVATRSLEFYNEYFGTAYPLPKCDFIALPDFSAGAMENWGCITFRESVLLVDGDNTSLMHKQYVAMVVAHELAHQWFGDLVTMQWWDDLWLNESFANWMEYYVLDALFPEWNMWLQYYSSETATALDKDALASVQKIRQPVNHPNEIRTLFDSAIVYAKGGSLVRMLHAYMGDADFREGLQTYMQRHAYKNTTMNDLLDCWSEASGKDITSFMQPWVSQAGHPLVVVQVDGQTAQLSQRRFYSNPKESQQTDGDLWPVPLLSQDVLDTELLEGQTLTTATNPTHAPLQLNRQRAGFYQLAYDEAHMAKLAAAVEAGDIDVLDRLGLLNDSYDLARSGVSSTKHMLQLLDSYRHESAQPVWGAITSCIGAIKLFVDDDEELRALLKTFVGELAQEQFQRLGWDKKSGESHFDELLRPAIVSLMCYSERPDVIQHALGLFAAAAQPEDVRADLRRVVFAAAARHGQPADFDRLLEWHQATTSAQIRTQLIGGLTSTRDETRIKQLLAMLTTNKVRLQDIFYWLAFLSGNRYAIDLLWQWTVDNWGWIRKNFESDMSYNNFAEYLARAFSKPQDLARYKAFFEPKMEELALRRDIQQSIEAIEARITWRQRDEAEVIAYLTKTS